MSRTQVMKPRPNTTPCPCCNGEKTMYNEKDRDPVEGWKLARRYDCQFCHGVGGFAEGHPQYVGVVAYHAAMWEAITRKRVEAERRQRALDANKKSALEKLSLAEIEALKELGI